MYLVPDMPHEVKVQMLREKYLAKQVLFHAEDLTSQREGTDTHHSRAGLMENTIL